MGIKAIRPYEMSVWTLRDSFLATLKAPGIENKGQIEEPEFTLKNDGTQEIKFKVPMYYWNNNQLIENPYWYDIKHGLLMTGLRKIKLIFNKKTKDEAVYEFLVTSINEEHASDNSLYCFVTASNLAFQELGKKGYNISLLSEDFLNEYNDFILQLEQLSEENEEFNYEAELENAPKQNINYWCDKIFENSDWDYSIQMDWTQYDGYILFALDTAIAANYPIVDIGKTGKATLLSRADVEILKLNLKNNTFDGNYISYESLTEEDKDELNKYREKLGLRRNDVIYEDEYISSWDINEENNSIAPSSYEKFKEKWRPVDAEKSNIYNLTQTVAEIFGVYCKYKYYYDDNYHIIKKEVIFYNNFIDEFNENINLTYGYDIKNIKRNLDSNEIFTKIIVTNVEDNNSASGILSILNTPTNITGENYILNFDYLYNTGSITEDQYAFVEEFKQQISFLNQKIKQDESIILEYQNQLNDLEANIEISNNIITQAQTQIEQSFSAIKALTENENGIIYAQKVFARFQMDTDNRYYIKITEKGVINDNSLEVYTNMNLTSASKIERNNYYIVRDSDGNIEKLAGFELSKSEAESLNAYLCYNYEPSLYYKNIINNFYLLMKKHKEQIELNTKKLDEIEKKLYGNDISDGNIENTGLINKRNYYLEQKQEMINEFERIMGPALREGTWQPENYNSLYSTQKFDISFSNQDIIANQGMLKYYWDLKEIEGEFLGYTKMGILEEVVSYPCIRLDNPILWEAIRPYFDPDNDKILKYCYEETLPSTFSPTIDDYGQLIYTAYFTEIFSASTLQGLKNSVKAAFNNVLPEDFDIKVEQRENKYYYTGDRPIRFVKSTQNQLEEAILLQGLQSLTGQTTTDLSKYTSSQKAYVREKYGLTRYNYKYFDLGSDLMPGFIKEPGHNVIPVLFLINNTIGLDQEENNKYYSTITQNGKFCLVDINVNNTINENKFISEEDILLDIPTYTDYSNILVDEQVTTLYPISENDSIDFIFDYKQRYTDVFPRIEINNLSLNDNSIELTSKNKNIENLNSTFPLVTWKKYENFSLLIRKDSYFITPHARDLFFNWKYDIDTFFNIDFNLKLQISNAELNIYLDALEVSKMNAYPKVSYEVEIAELNEKFIKTSYNQLNKIVHINDWELKFHDVLGYISEITLYLNEPWKDKVGIKNYKTKFEDLFSKIIIASQQIQANLSNYNRAAAAFDSNGFLKNNILQNSIINSGLNLSFLNNNLTIDQNNGILAKSDDGILMFDNTGLYSANEKTENGKWIWNSAFTAAGLNASMIKTGTIDTNLIRIYAGENLRFQMNADGLFAFRAKDDEQANQNEYVVHNSEGLFLVNKAGTIIGDNSALEEDIARVEISWDGIIIRDLNNQKVFYADNNGNLILSGIIQAYGGKIGGWDIQRYGITSKLGQISSTNVAGMASAILDDQSNAITNSVFKVFWAGLDNSNNSRFYVNSLGNVFASSLIVNESLVANNLTLDGIPLAQVIPELKNATKGIHITPLNGNNFNIMQNGAPELSSLQFAVTVRELDNFNIDNFSFYYNNRKIDDFTFSYVGTNYLTFFINYEIINQGQINHTFRLEYTDINNDIYQDSFSININYLAQEFINILMETSPTDTFRNGIALNSDTITITAQIYKNGVLINSPSVEYPSDIYLLQWYKRSYLQSGEIHDQAILGANTTELNVGVDDLIDRQIRTFLFKISRRINNEIIVENQITINNIIDTFNCIISSTESPELLDSTKNIVTTLICRLFSGEGEIDTFDNTAGHEYKYIYVWKRHNQDWRIENNNLIEYQNKTLELSSLDLENSNIFSCYVYEKDEYNAYINGTASQPDFIAYNEINIDTTIRKWMTFDEQTGLWIRKQGSHWTTLTDENGYHIYKIPDELPSIDSYNINNLNWIGSFAKNSLMIPRIRMGNLIVQTNEYYGWSWVGLFEGDEI